MPTTKPGRTASALAEHADLKITIEEQTDIVGNAAANQVLSERRAAALARRLAAAHGSDAGRLVSKGFGAAKPVTSNDTPRGRQSNRRVKLVRM